ncbi:GlxA family transcriptional regulator [Nocardia neocaledoniensis]|uniref:AraC family transcriptional regulator with amidase-like domain n=1 Tax=Nocardia neocaledoniensis TaxID=236511 RepID=A0A317NYN2_9NOCA|nr:helix-turn-helix domain-containing protein [Nocardia neocaledoniensis]PWV79254.1 AraC family transcriptional regulator with amidase-like domain [Nocardia neocaledoniensis]
MKTVAVLAVPPVKSFDLAMPGTLLESALVDGEPGYRVIVCTAEPGVVPANSGGFDVVIPHGLETLETADIVIVPSTGSRAGVGPAVLSALRAAVDRGTLVTSICSGAFVLAQAGLLDGRTATTHWGLADELATAFPAVTVRADALFIEDGPVTTSAGAAAGIDLCLHLIRADYGAAVANAAARAAVVTPVRPGGQAQFVDTALPADEDLSLSATRTWAMQRLDTPLSLRELAGHANTSVRTLTRRFHEETGLSPQKWLLHQRLLRARALLESTSLPIEQVARHSGIGTAESLRQHMIRHLGVPPSTYRANFTTAR